MERPSETGAFFVADSRLDCINHLRNFPFHGVGYET